MRETSYWCAGSIHAFPRAAPLTSQEMPDVARCSSFSIITGT